MHPQSGQSEPRREPISVGDETVSRAAAGITGNSANGVLGEAVDTTAHPDSGTASRLVPLVEQLLALRAPSPERTMEEACSLVAKAMGADRVYACLLEADRAADVGASGQGVAGAERSIGMERAGGTAPEDAARSRITAPLELGPESRGVLVAVSDGPQAFTEADRRLLATAARWIGLLAQRAAWEEQQAEANWEHRAEELVTVAAHDLRNHLQPLLGHLQLLRQRALRDQRPEYVRHADEVARAARRLNRVITAVLDTTRLQQGLFTVRPRAVDLVALAREAAEEFRTDDTGIEVQAGSAVVVRGDRDLLQQVVENLLANAVRYSPPAAVVWLRVGIESLPKGPRALLTITDAGPGVPAEVAPRLFEPFASGPNSTSLGLGLYLARQIARAHGGDVWTEAPGAGRGSTFVLVLPLDGGGATG